MKKIAVITGDLVNSTQVAAPSEFRQALAQLLGGIEEQHKAVTSIHRGDGFQIALPQTANPFHVAILIRAALISQSPDKEDRWDARMAIAMGEGKLSLEHQNSEVYVQSGRCLDSLKDQRLAISAGDETAALGFNVATAFMDDLIEQWTLKEAEVMYYYLKEKVNHQQIAQQLNKKRATITLALKRAKYNLVNHYIDDMNSLMQYYEQP